MSLRLPAALAFTVVGTVAAVSCGESRPTADARCRYCVYQGSDNGNCPPPTCATGANRDRCPAGCILEPIV
jgi:hypothetical protein